MTEKQNIDGITETPDDATVSYKESVRRMIAQQTADYLASGKTIELVSPYVHQDTHRFRISNWEERENSRS